MTNLQLTTHEDVQERGILRSRKCDVIQFGILAEVGNAFVIYDKVEDEYYLVYYYGIHKVKLSPLLASKLLQKGAIELI